MVSLLIADDDPDHLTLSRLTLEEGLPECRICTAQSGSEVLRAFTADPFDVALLDYRLPDMDGLTILAELRRASKRPPIVIILTGLGSEEVAAAALRLGADDYLPKIGNYTSLLPAVIERAIQRRRLQELEREFEAQRAIERNKLAFLESVNHELRTPLTMIVGYSELLARRGCPIEDVPSYGREIHTYANRLTTLIERLLEAATLEPLEDPGAARVRAVDLAALVREVVGESVEGESSRHIVVEGVDAARALVDPRLFRRALHEVLGNALKFSPPGQTVTISIESSEEAVVITVKDRGPGIPVEERERVFLPFYRIDNDSTITVRGLGLGLTRARQLINAQGGQVSIEDAPQALGACVRLAFRVARSEEG